MSFGRNFQIVASLFCVAAASAVHAQSVVSSDWVAKTVASLNGGSAVARQSARLQLIRAGEMKGAPATYPAMLASALMPVIRTGSPRAKLNAAIAIERVAGKTANPSLVPAVNVLLDDSSEAIALWGIKAARPLIAAGGPGASALADHLAATVKAHSGSGPIVEEAYAALLTDPVQPAMVDPLLTLLEARTAAYGTGALPPSPLAERSLPAYLSATCWPQATAAGRVRILTALARFTCAAAGALADGNTDLSLLKMTQTSAVGIETISTQLGNDPLAAAAKDLEKLRLDDAASIPARCKALDSALSNMGIDLRPVRSIHTAGRD